MNKSILRNSKKVISNCLMFLVLIGCEQQRMSSDGITLNFSFNEKNPEYEDVFKETSIIKLETNKNCLVSEISEMEIYDDKILILDWKLNALYVFNTEGKFLQQLGQIGRGPGEYIRPRYFFVNKDEKIVKVFDAPTMKLICFDIEGNLKSEIKFNSYLRGVSETKTEYLGFCPNKSNLEVDDKEKRFIKYIVFDKEGKIKSYIKGEESIDRINFSTAYKQSSLHNGISFVEPFMPNIYSLVDGEVSVKYKINFSGHYPSDNAISKIKKLDYPLSSDERKILADLELNYASNFTYFFENENWLFLTSNFKYTNLLYNKNLKNTIEFSNSIFKDDSWETFFTPVTLNENKIYCQASYNDLKNVLKKGKCSDKRKKSLDTLLDKMKENDNPLIIRYTIND